MKFVAPFSSLSKKDADIAGGKGASLGEMLNAGIPVPDGFVVLSTTFDEFIEQADLTAEIEAILERVDHKAIHTVDEASEKIQELIKKTSMPAPIAAEILSSFKELDCPFVAVRSSATAEDGADHAWAGQLDSYLNTTEATLLTRVQECWASLFTPRAIFYRFEKGLHDTHISVAVVVQKMVNSEVSGIAFSVHPVTEDRNQLIIEAGFGLGEAIVSGSITPDSYVVEKEPRKILDINVSTQERKLIRKEKGGNEWVTILEPEASSQVLTEKQITELAQIIIGIENHYGFPCDIEWAFEAGKFYIVQSRPITTLSDLEKTEVDLKKADFVDSLKKSKKWVPIVERHICLLIQDLILSGEKSAVFNKALGVDIDPVGDASLCGHVFSSIESIENTNNAMQILVDKYGYKKLMEIASSCLERANELHKYLEVSKDIELVDRLDNFKKLYIQVTCYLLIVVFSEKFLEKRVESLIKEKTGEDNKRYFESIAYVRKFNKNTEELVAILELSKLIKKEKYDVNSEIVTKLFKKHSEEYGWLGTRWQFENSWNADDIKSRVKRYLNGDIEKQLSDVLQPREEAEIVTNEFIQKYNLNFEEIKLIDLVKEFVFLRTFRTECLARANYLVKPFLQEASEILKVNKDDVVFLTIDEIINAINEKIEHTSVIEKRKNGYYIILCDDIIKIFTEEEKNLIDKLGVYNYIVSDSDKISGQIAWRGVAKGKVRIVKGQKDISKVKEGDILVAVMTFPNYIPAMEKASAFVTDEGGILCHAAIISREMKKPCIIGTKNATQVFKDGDLVEVDADQGVVHILESLKKTDVEISKDAYILTFWAEGVSPLVTDISREGYAELEVLYIIEHGRFKQYFPKKVYERALDEGLEFYKNARSVEGYQQVLNDHIKSFEDFFLLNIKDKQTISEKNVAEFFKYAVRLSKEYLKMGFEYTDKAFAHQDENEVLKKNLAIVSKYKDEVREFVNKVFFKSENFLLSLLQILSKQFSLSLSILENSTQQELLNLFKGIQLDTDKIQKRRESFVCIYNNPVPFEGAEAETIVDIFTEKVSNTNEIKGQTASRGKISGKVKIIPVDYSDFTRINNEIEKMDQGDILVAETTAPELIVACKKAGAIITDMGGLMSHAAIVSREFGIPCIVGTGNASKILKDGDLVEVDADNGIVFLMPNEGKKVQDSIAKASIKFKGIETSRQEGNYSLLIFGSLLPGCLPPYSTKYYSNAQLSAALLFINDEHSVTIFSWEDYVSFTKEAYQKYSISNKDFKNVADFQKTWKKINNWYKKYPVATLKKFSVEDLVESLNDIFRECHQFVAETVFCESLSEPEIKTFYEQAGGNAGDFKKFLDISSKPVFDSFMLRQDTILLSTTDVNSIQRIFTNYFLAPDLEEIDKKRSEYINQRGGVEKIKEEIKTIRKEIAIYSKEVKKYRSTLSKPLKLLFDFVQLCMYLRDVRKEPLQQVNTLISNFSKEIFTKLGYNPKDAVYGYCDDFLNHTYKLPNYTEEIALRKTGVIVYTSQKEIFFEYGEHKEKLDKALKQFDKMTSQDTLQGSVAYKGLVRGKVKIMRNEKDFSRFEQGDILVTSMTRPEFVPLMKIAAAVVTDEGGVTCHAAIISRELKLPCIIGTKHATRLLKDGDTVEVDANQGIIRIVT